MSHNAHYLAWQKPPHVEDWWWDALDLEGAELEEWYRLHRVMGEARRALHGLSIEMAEAILAWDELTQYAEAVEYMNPAYQALVSMADKLRAIGGKCLDGPSCDDEGCRARRGDIAHEA